MNTHLFLSDDEAACINAAVEAADELGRHKLYIVVRTYYDKERVERAMAYAGRVANVMLLPRALAGWRDLTSSAVIITCGVQHPATRAQLARRCPLAFIAHPPVSRRKSWILAKIRGFLTKNRQKPSKFPKNRLF